MHITTSTAGNLLAMSLVGRLDNDSAGDLNAAIDEILRNGHHAVTVDLSSVDYMSSAGLGALVRAYKRFRTLKGMFGVLNPTSHVGEVLRLSGVAKLLLADPDEISRWGGGAQTTTLMPKISLACSAGLILEIYELLPSAKMECCVWGKDTPNFTGRFEQQTSTVVPMENNMLGLGLGALGNEFADCANRFGEFLAVAGAVAVQPTPGGGKPDYQLAAGEFIPRPHLLYGLSCRGDYSRLIRFSRDGDAPRVKLSTLVEQCLAQVNSQVAAMVFIAETSGLIGATLRRSPAMQAETKPTFAHPEVCKWLSFTPEHVYINSLSLVVGVASRGVPHAQRSALAPLVRPLVNASASVDDDPIYGHFHAAVFPYRPLKKRSLDLSDTVNTLFESESLQGVIHLLNDQRPITGGGESEFVSGACWIAPIENLTAGENAS